MRDKEALGRVVVIGTQRKGNGAVGGGRKGKSGKKGVIYQLDNKGQRTELGRASGSTMKDLSRNLRATGHIPQYVTLNNYGETSF